MADTPKGRRLLVAGGGTGGHLFPGIAIAEAFLELAGPGAQVLFVGTSRGLEARVLPERGFALELLEVGRLKGRSLGGKLLTLLGLPLALLRAARIVLRFSPGVVIGVGGYVSGPVVLAARLLGKKTAIQEQNSVPGLTNRILGKIVHRVFIAFAVAGEFFGAGKTLPAGNPVRKEIARADLPRELPQKPHVLVLGGSQGARALNLAAPEAYRLLAARYPDLGWTHQSGAQDLGAAKAAYQGAGAGAGAPGAPEVIPFIDDMLAALARSSLVVGRAGASTLAELCILGRPSILVPYPHAADNHQEGNARDLEAAGAARVLLEKDLTAKRLAEEITRLLDSPAQLAALSVRARAHARPLAAREIARECLSLSER